jgi:predicted RNA-binding Zn-ribbon protein involved in translation (DUF1610 family)
MPDLITLTCPTCGAKLKVTDQIHLLACRNCGNEHMVVRDSGSMYLAPLAQDVRGIRVGVDKTAAELAIVRLIKEISSTEAALRSAQAVEVDKWLPPGGAENAIGMVVPLSLIAVLIGIVYSIMVMVAWCAAAFLISFVAFGVISSRRTLSELADKFEDHLTSNTFPCPLLKQHGYPQICAMFT